MEQFATKSLTVIKQFSEATIRTASELLKEGKLVSFPTETVYGLGASALNADACKLIFTTKGRPLTDPLIVHVHSLEHGLSVIDHSDEKVLSLFKTLAGKYWPGPLTMVVRANMDVIPSLVTAGTGFVGVRMPNHQVALDLIKTSGLPLAAPSANKFGHVSPSRAEHVYSDFHRDSEVFIIDGGPCSFGIESTVLKITYNYEIGKYELLVLRRGGVSE
jgi:tRNA threonylcarbamoyl adenosine modification protein (Sua5/YciO/YrdC/YwlC family)